MPGSQVQQEPYQPAKKTIRVYIDDGRVFEYDIFAHGIETTLEEKAMEHCWAIASKGYRHCAGDVFEVYPPWRILKVKTFGITTSFPDRTVGT